MPYNIIFLDWKMPGMNGLDAARRIKRVVGDSAVVIMISVADWSEIKSEATEIGVDKFLAKPILPSVLFNTIVEITECGVVNAMQQVSPERYDWAGKHILLAEDIEINRKLSSISSRERAW